MQHKHDIPRLRLGHLILAQALSTLLVFTTPIFAGSAMAEPAARQYQIPPGSLKDALAQFGREAQVMLSYNSELVSGLHNNGLNKTASVRDGLEQLLTGTGLEAVAQENGGYMLRKSNKPATGSSESTLDEVRVSASKDPTTENTGSYTTSSTGASAKLTLSLRHTPQSVSVITRQRMDDQNLTQLQEVLEQTVGISVVQSGYVGANWNEFQSRGFTINNYLVDGLPLGSGFQQMTNDMAFYDRVEVLRGSSGLMVGIGAPGGSINYVRKKPTREFQASVTGQFGSWDNYRGMVDISTPFNVDGSVRGRIVAVKQDSGSHLDRYGLERDMLYGILEADLTPSTLFTAGLEYQNHETHDSPEAGLPLFYSDGSHTNWKRSKNPGASWASSENEKLAFFTSLEHSFDNDWRAKVQFNHIRHSYDSIIGSGGSGSLDKATGSGVSLWGGRWKADPIKQNALDVYATGPFTLGGRQHELVFGLNYSHIEQDNDPSYTLWHFISVADYRNWNGNVAQPDMSPIGRYSDRSRQFGGYLTARFRPTDEWSILAGTRVIHWHHATEDRSETGVLTPYVATTYDLTDTASLYASYTRIFNPQSYRDRNGSYLDPEEGNSYEVGVKHAFYGGRLNTSLALFRVEQDNLAVQDGAFLAPNGNVAYRAEQGTVSKGFEAEANGELAPGWQLSGGYTFRISQNADGDKVQTVVPQNLFKLFTTYTLPGAWNKLTVGGGANWQSRIYTNDTGPNNERFTQGSYAVVNLMARYQFDERFSAALNVNNLFDKVYYTNTASGMGFYGVPRNAMLTLKYQF
ncbi:TonB-dependent siderophore receptor [Methylobacillus flagellatus]|uniref:TonB-dependent siderophore receptor n=1 Tax=Methylobacillus flagellatus TaxID=405 RepID=UPI002853A387|nr:TonB-dependent siderophore receptor [Methylobacillus flagellatus]MDR5172091.1 TonB-dependent siderophore receptor [Methylobacillus flagellatus]